MVQASTHHNKFLRTIAILVVTSGILLGIAQPQYGVLALPPETLYVGNPVPALTNQDDLASGILPIGFTYSYFGNNYTNFYVTTNGILCFSAPSTAYSNAAIPTAAVPNNCMFPLWDDLYSRGAPLNSVFYYRTIGAAPNRELIAQWTNYGYYSPDIPIGTFQVILYEGSNQIRFQYRQLLTPPYSYGSSATVGVENSAGTAGTQYSYNTANAISQEQSILWTYSGGVYSYNAAAAYEPVLLVASLANPPPGVPNLVSPANNATRVSPSPTFTWQAAQNATSYTLVVSTNANLSTPIINVSGIAGTSYSYAGSLTQGTLYYWAVTAVNANGTGRSNIWRFTVDRAPTAIALNPSSMAENQPINTVVGTLSTTDPDAGDTFTYTLVAGAGSADNASFNILGNSLRTSAVFDYETKNGYSIRVRSTDSGGLFFEQQFTITVTNVNEPPVINDQTFSLAENSPNGTVVGTVLASDPDAGDSLTFAITAGNTGNTFAINPASGQITVNDNSLLNFETNPSFSLTVQVTDLGSLSSSATVTINLTNVIESDLGIIKPPTLILMLA